MELPGVVAVVIAVPLLLLVVEFTTCAASCPESMDDEVPAAVSRRRAHPRWAAWPHAAQMCCLHIPFASAALVEKTGYGPPRGPTR